MTHVLLFHHACGLTPGITSFAETLRGAGHTVDTPDLFDGQLFQSPEKGVEHARDVGFDTLLQRAQAVAEQLPNDLVYAGFSLGVLAAQMLAQTRAGARGALLFESCLPTAEFGSWPEGVPVQIHGMDRDPIFAGEGDLDAARALAESTSDAELFLYPGPSHLFADASLATFDEAAADLMTQRVLRFLDTL